MRRLTATMLLTALLLTLAAPVSASPLTDKRERAEAVKADVDALDVELEIAAEDYNEAFGAHADLIARIDEAEAELERLRERIGFLQNELDLRAAHMYRQGPLGMLEVLLDTSTFSDFATAWDLLTDLSRNDAVRIRELHEARVQTERTEEELQIAEAGAKVELDAMTAAKEEVEARLAERERLLSGLEGEIAALEEEERRRAQQAAEEARRQAEASSPSESYSPPTRAARSEVVAIAMQYLGTPYSWGASGPNAFDCSGFTMYVYRQVGVSLPHSSRAQYNCGERVSRADLQAGDLVFFGSSGIHHVGIYVGGGEYIHAPHTGAVVRVDPLNRSDYVGAARP